MPQGRRRLARTQRDRQRSPQPPSRDQGRKANAGWSAPPHPGVHRGLRVADGLPAPTQAFHIPAGDNQERGVKILLPGLIFRGTRGPYVP